MAEPLLTVRLLRLELTRALGRVGVPDPAGEARQMLCHTLGLNETQLFAAPEQPVEAKKAAGLRQMVVERARHVPLGYLLGTVWFSGLAFMVGPGVLVPRPDSEVLVETARCIVHEHLKNGRHTQGGPVHLLDTCTGSGCVGISLAGQLEQEGFAVRLTLLDKDEAALAWTRRNVALHPLRGEVAICKGDLFPPQATEQFDLIIANPPYVETEIIAGLMPEVSRYEPVLALDGGQDGLALYRRLAKEAPDRLQPGGWLVVEHGYSQAEAVSAILEQENYHIEAVKTDFGGNPRVCAARLTSR